MTRYALQTINARREFDWAEFLNHGGAACNALARFAIDLAMLVLFGLAFVLNLLYEYFGTKEGASWQRESL